MTATAPPRPEGENVLGARTPTGGTPPGPDVRRRNSRFNSARICWINGMNSLPGRIRLQPLLDKRVSVEFGQYRTAGARRAVTWNPFNGQEQESSPCE